MGNSNGTLAFTLGLEAGSFLSVAGKAERGLAGIFKEAAKLTGISALVGTAFESLKGSASIIQGVFAAFQRGADLERLHARTGETVSDLFLLQKGFRAVGLEADGVGQMLFHLQKSLTGVSELGENTAVDFAMMGLNMRSIRAMNAPQQFEAIAGALVKMDRATGSAIAGKLFGREGAASFLQIARSGKDFADAMQQNAAAAAQMERNAAAFNKIEVSLASIKMKGENFFAGIAEGAAPGIQRILDMLNGIDFSAIGKKFGDVVAVFTQSIKDAKLGELLSLSLNAGLEKFSNYFQAILAGINAAMQKFFVNMIDSKLMSQGQAEKWSGLKQIFHGNFKAGSASISAGNADILASYYSSGKGVLDAFGKAFGESLKGGDTSAATALANLFASALAKVPEAVTSSVNGAGSIGAANKPFAFTDIEKRGFHFGGSNAPTLMSDHLRAAQQTAKNTQTLVQILTAKAKPDLNHMVVAAGAYTQTF